MARSARPTSAYDKHLAARLDQIEAMLERLAAGEGGADPKHTHDHSAACGLPEVPERTFDPSVSSQREELIRYIDKKWVNGTRLNYYLFDTGPFAGSKTDRDFIHEAFNIWADVGIGLTFEETKDISEAEIRVGFKRGDGSWSYVGRDILQFPGQFERTMNIGWDLRHDPRGVDTAVHEIGHTLGFPHEHQNPFAGIVWDEEAVYRHFAGPPNNWSRTKTFHNVLRKLSSRDVEGSDWDPDSIMHYGFAAGLIESPAEYRNGLKPKLGLSEKDKSEVLRFYPPAALDTVDLNVFHSHVMEMEPAEQINFSIKPDATREYSMGSFGSSDVLMVLFRMEKGVPRYVAGSDDSGTEDNARITARLSQGEEYVLRVRMFASYGTDEMCVMYW